MDAELITTLITAMLAAASVVGAVVTLLHERGMEVIKILRSALGWMVGKSRKP